MVRTPPYFVSLYGAAGSACLLPPNFPMEKNDADHWVKRLNKALNKSQIYAFAWPAWRNR